MEHEPTRVTFLGTGSVVPDAGDDTASFLINGTCLVDTGWYAAVNMLRYGFTPLDLEYVFLTHCHHDHYLGLAGVLFFLSMRRSERPDRPPLRVVGPADDIRTVVSLARAYLQTERFPDVECHPVVLPLSPGESIDAAGLRVTTAPSKHPVQGMIYRFTERRTGASVVISGDTAYQAETVELAHGCDLLVHEASYGARTAKPAEAARWGHSGAPEAARVAREAGARRLALVHCRSSQQGEILTAAQRVFPASFCPCPGQSESIIVGGLAR